MKHVFPRQAVDTSAHLRLLSRFTSSGPVSSSGGVAQLAEQRTHKPRVTRSIRVTATKLALRVADYAITEAGFGADLGAEKFFDISGQKFGSGQRV